MDLVIKNARLRNEKKLMDIAIKDGLIVKIQPSINDESEKIIDAKGKLTVPAFIEPHIHLDKVNIVDVVRPNKSGTLMEAIEIIWDKKANYTTEDIVSRAKEVVKLAVKNGITRIRTHVDVDTIGGLKPLEGVLELRRQCSHFVDIQIVAFPQEGILKDPGCEDLLREAMRMGADLIGGMPANENSPDESRQHVKIVFDIAEEFDVDIDMHVDETDDPFYRTLEMVADETIKRGYLGRVTAGHTCALAAYDDHYAEYVMDKVKNAQINIITNPATNLMLQGRLDKQPKRRGITRVKELIEKGVNVSFGQDCVKDTFYPFGSADPLQVALIAAHAAHMSLPHEIEEVFNMPTYNAAKILRLTDYGIEVGKRADIVVIDAENIRDAIRFCPPRLYVIRKGKIIAKNEMKSEILI